MVGRYIFGDAAGVDIAHRTSEEPSTVTLMFEWTPREYGALFVGIENDPRCSAELRVDAIRARAIAAQRAAVLA